MIQLDAKRENWSVTMTEDLITFFVWKRDDECADCAGGCWHPIRAFGVSRFN